MVLFVPGFQGLHQEKQKSLHIFPAQGAAQTSSVSLLRAYSPLGGNTPGICTDSRGVGFLHLPSQNLGKESAVDQQEQIQSMKAFRDIQPFYSLFLD